MDKKQLFNIISYIFYGISIALAVYSFVSEEKEVFYAVLALIICIVGYIIKYFGTRK